MSTPETPAATHAQHRIDVFATVLLALATIATAWAGYQSSRWHSEQAKLQMKATATRIESTRSQDIADRETQVDVALFIQWVDAQTLGETELAKFYSDRFSDRLAPAFKAWIAKEPLENSAAPESPFAMRQYKVASTRRGNVPERRGRRVRCPGHGGHPTGRQLRLCGRPVRCLPFLRWFEHADALGREPEGDPRDGISPVRRIGGMGGHVSGDALALKPIASDSPVRGDGSAPHPGNTH